MGTWYSLALGDVLTAQGVLAGIREAFDATQPRPDSPPRAVYTRQVSGELHCEITAYFSPGADRLALRFGAQPCPEPGRRGLELLAGDATVGVATGQ